MVCLFSSWQNLFVMNWIYSINQGFQWWGEKYNLFEKQEIFENWMEVFPSQPGCSKLFTQHTNVWQQNCCIHEVSGNHSKFWMPYFCFLLFTLALHSSLVENYLAFLFIWIFWPERLHNIYTFLKTSKTLMRFSVLTFWRFSA